MLVQLQSFFVPFTVRLSLCSLLQVERYDPNAGRWTACVPMLTRRCRLGVATLNGKLYVCGGYDGSTFLQTVEMFDPVTNQ